jgi:hypothetical protein
LMWREVGVREVGLRVCGRGVLEGREVVGVWVAGRCWCGGVGMGVGGGEWVEEELLGLVWAGVESREGARRGQVFQGLWLGAVRVLERRPAHLRGSSKGSSRTWSVTTKGCSRPPARSAFRSAVRPNGGLDAIVRVAGSTGPATRRGRYGCGCRVRRRSGLVGRVWSVRVNSRCESSEGQRPRRAWYQIVPAAQESVPRITRRTM